VEVTFKFVVASSMTYNYMQREQHYAQRKVAYTQAAIGYA
jgi:hypothetical protein